MIYIILVIGLFRHRLTISKEKWLSIFFFILVALDTNMSGFSGPDIDTVFRYFSGLSVILYVLYIQYLNFKNYSYIKKEIFEINQTKHLGFKHKVWVVLSITSIPLAILRCVGMIFSS